MIGILDAANYAFAYGRISAMPQYLGDAVYASILGAPTLEAALIPLINTHFGGRIQKVISARGTDKEAKIDIAKIEREITDHYMQTCLSVVDTLPSSVKESSKAILTLEFDVINLKKILRGITAIPKKNLEIILSECISGNIKDEILKDIANSEFSSAIEKIKKLGFNVEAKSLLEIENELDLNLINKWKREAEKIKAATNYIMRQIDMINLKAIIRMKLLKDKSKINIEDFINKTPEGLFLKKNILTNINAIEISRENFNLEAINNEIRTTPYGDIFKDALESYKETKSLEKLELMIENTFAKFGLVQNPLSLDYVLSYLKRMWFDARNVRVMLVCKKYQIERAEIEKLLVR